MTMNINDIAEKAFAALVCQSQCEVDQLAWTYNNTVVPSKYRQLDESSNKIPTSSNVSSNKDEYGQ